MDNDNLKEQENLEKEISASEQRVGFEEIKKEEYSESTEILPEDKKAIDEILMREVERLESIQEMDQEAKAKANEIGAKGLSEAFDHLFEIARLQGLAKSLHVAKRTGDPFIFDTFRDFLAKDGRYKQYPQ